MKHKFIIICSIAIIAIAAYACGSYVTLNNITEVSSSNAGIQIYFNDGTGYWIEREEGVK